MQPNYRQSPGYGRRISLPLLGSWTGVLGALLLLLSVTSIGVNASRAQSKVLHERVPDLRHDEAELVLARLGLLSAIEHNGRVVTEPEGGELRDDEVPMTAAAMQVSGQMDAPGMRSTVYYPDRNTSLEGTLDYYPVFTPSIAPFKRVTAFDRVVLGADGRTPGLSTSVGRRERVQVEAAGSSAPDGRARDKFWGSVVLDFGAGEAVPLPSVSPESRILSFTTEPAINVRIERDVADNFYAVRVSRDAPDQVRVTMLTDAPRSYFGGPIPEVPANSLRAEAVPLERSIQRRAETFASELGIGASEPLPRVLSVLTEHFRSFVESSTPPSNTGDTYLDLSRGKKGICRHRAYGFVVTALGLGIPTRFVQNEAHSWVEVKLPSAGWMRIDLGGAAGGIAPNADNNRRDERPAYRPAAPDPLPRPQAYEDAYAQAARSGVTPPEARQPDSTQQADERADERAARRVQQDNLEQAQGQWVQPDHERPATDEQTRTAVGMSKRVPMQAEDVRGKRAVRIRLEDTSSAVYRGQLLDVRGQVTTARGEPVEGLRIEVALGRTDKSGDEASLLLGVTVSDADGRFESSFGIPMRMAPGDYDLRVATPGNSRYLPAVAR